VPSARLLARLDSLIAETIEQFEHWSAAETRRQAADALATRARAVRSAELERLWRRVPSLNDDERAEVERAFDHATERLLREPLEQLGRDGDGRHVQAVRELFRL
jgi:glutamyl-tRNA reductase